MSFEFTTTRWTIILSAANTSLPESRPALETLCRQYWKPLYTYARNRGQGHQDAQDITQAFFGHLLSSNLPSQADRTLGRFRSFLLTAMKNFMNSQYRASTTQRRGGQECVHLSFDEAPWLESTLTVDNNPEVAFERQWARTVVDFALDRLAKRQADSGHADRFAVMRPMLLEPDRAGEAQQVLMSSFGMTEGGIRTSLSRLRSSFRDLVREEVSRLVDDPSEIDDEISYLLKALR